MKVEQIYTGCLAHGAYYIESDGEVAIIDPLREVDDYIKRANENNAKIKYIFETHFHADFVSGHLTLAEKTGGTIVYGKSAEPKFDAYIAKENESFKLGKVSIVALHTPGHTLESTTYLLKDENGKDYAIFSGDTLFLGDVGRPDLAQKAGVITQEDLAGMLFDSLRNKIMPLADDVIVYPGHGAGSACGKNLSKETVDTLGHQKETNYALRANMTKEEFIKEVTEGLTPPPAYFPFNVQMNKEGYTSIDELLEKGKTKVSVEDFEHVVEESEAIVLDVRHQDDFVKGFIPKSIFIGIHGGFAPWVGTLIKDVNQPLLLVVDEGLEKEVITRLSRVGFDNVIGCLDGGFDAWKNAKKPIDIIESISPQEFEKRLTTNTPIFDVRKIGEYHVDHIDGANHTPLSYLNDYLDEFPKNEKFYVHCAGGYRSVIASSILKSRGIHNLVNVEQGYKGIKETSIKRIQNDCLSK